MELTIEQAEMFPSIAASTPARKRSPLREMIDAISVHGPLLPQGFMHIALDMSRQRVHQLIADGRIATIHVAGKQFIPLAALDVFLSEERKTGRPAKDPTLARMAARAFAEK
jgi:hypothetical protein